MKAFRYRCVARCPVGGNLDDMPAPVQVHFEPVGGDVIGLLNRWSPFSPVLSRGEADHFEVGAEYEFTPRKVDGERPQA